MTDKKDEYEEPKKIQCRVAYVLCGHIISSMARNIERRSKKQGRQYVVNRLRIEAGEIYTLAEKATGSLNGVDAACLGYLLAWLGGDTGSKGEIIAEMHDLGLSARLKNIDWNRKDLVCQAVIGR